MRFPTTVVSLCIAASLSANVVSAQAPTDNWSDTFNRAWDWFQQSQPSGVPPDVQNALETAREHFASQSFQIPTITHTFELPTDLSNKIPTSIINQLPTEFDNNGPPFNKNKLPDSLGDPESDPVINTASNKFSAPNPMTAPTGSNKSVPTGLPKGDEFPNGTNKSPPSNKFGPPGENKNSTANKIGPTGAPDEPPFDDEGSGPPFDEDDEFFDDQFPPEEGPGPNRDGPPQLWRPAPWRPEPIKAWEMYREEMSAEDIEDPAEIWALRQKQIKEEHDHAPHVEDVKEEYGKVEGAAHVENVKGDHVKMFNALAANALDDNAANPTTSPSDATIGGMQSGIFYAVIAAAAVCVVVLIMGAVSYGIIVSRRRNEARKEHMRMMKEVSAVGPDLRTSLSAPPEEASHLLDQRTSVDVEAQRSSVDSRISLDSARGGRKNKRVVLS